MKGKSLEVKIVFRVDWRHDIIVWDYSSESIVRVLKTVQKILKRKSISSYWN